MDVFGSGLQPPSVVPPVADYVSVFTEGELAAIAALALLPAILGPLPIFIGVLIGRRRDSYLPYFVMGFWALAAAIPMALAAFGVLDRGRMLYGGYDFAAQILLMPAFLFPVFYLSAFVFTLAFGARRPGLFFILWLGIGALMAAPWFIFAFHGL
jgi:hypothetical protein